MSQDRSGAIDVGAGSGDGTDDIDFTSLKEAFELPDSLPPIRLPSIAELAAQARQAPLAGQLAALAAWVGAGGRRIDEAGDLSPADAAAAAAAAGAGADDFAYLWEYAIAADWLSDDDADEDRVLPGEAAEAWTDDTDEDVCFAWFVTLGAVLTETLEVAGAPEAPGPARGYAPAAGEDGDYDGADDQDDEDDEDERDEPDDDGGGEPALDFLGLPLALAILLFTSRAEGVPRAELAEVFWADAAVDMTAAQAAVAREEWLAAYGDPVELLLGKLAELAAITEAGGTVRLTPLALADLRDQLVEEGVDIPLLPPTAAELTGAELLAMAEGVSEEEFYAESAAWAAARGAAPAARELLDLGAHGDPGDRLLAVAAVTRIGAAAAPAWRDSLNVPPMSGYAKITLAMLEDDGSAGRPAGLEPSPADVAWMATDLLALACDDEYPDPDELVVTFNEVVPAGGEAALFDAMSRGVHPDAVAVLNHVGKYHPDKRVAKAARTAAHKAASRAQ
jgi:hypothetical protein